MVAKTFTSASPEFAVRNLFLCDIIAIASAFEKEGGLQNVHLPRNKKHFRDCKGSGLFWYNNNSGSTDAIHIKNNFQNFLDNIRISQN